MDLQRRLRVISKTLAEDLRGIPGIFYEDKDLSVAIHYRGAEDQAAALGRIQRALGEADLTGFAIKGGKKLVQIRPVGGINKGSTVSLLMKERGLTQGLYAGDDLTDLDVFAAFRDLRAEGYNVVSVGVVDAETNPRVPEAADYVAAGPTEVGRLLVWLCEPRPSEA
jgi:trehalose 6-phosphate phosphatase